MEQNKFFYCPQCGSKNIQTKDIKWVCPDCKFDLYMNVASAVGIVLQREDGKILFERRVKEPRKGCLAIPGGFTSPDEDIETSAIRECREEIGIEPENLHYIASFPNTYPYKNIVYKTCDIFFAATLPKNAQFKIQETEVSLLEWHEVNTAQDVENLNIAFDSTKYTLLKLINDKAMKN